MKKIHTKLSLLFILYFCQGLPGGFLAEALPVILRQQGLSLTQIGFAAFLGEKNITGLDLKDNLLKSLACKGSYRSGESMNPVEANLLIQIVFEGKLPLTCPHGRPYVYTMTRKELAGKFLRG